MAVPARSRLLELTKVLANTLQYAHIHVFPSFAQSTPLLPSSCGAPLINSAQLQCSIFSTIFNPMRQRLGNKILRQRLKGPKLAAYYPRRSATVEDVMEEFKKFDLVGENEDEAERLEDVARAKLRGKGAPKKKKTAEGKKMTSPDQVLRQDEKPLDADDPAPLQRVVSTRGRGEHEHDYKRATIILLCVIYMYNACKRYPRRSVRRPQNIQIILETFDADTAHSTGDKRRPLISLVDRCAVAPSKCADNGWTLSQRAQTCRSCFYITIASRGSDSFSLYS